MEKCDPQNINWGYAAKTAGFGVNANNESFFDVNYNDEETPHTKWKSNNRLQKMVLHDFGSAVWVLLKVDEDDLEIMSGSLDQVKVFI